MERNPMSQAKTTRLMALALVLMALCALSLVACSAATQTKQGAPGERCLAQEDDCRPGLYCHNSVCTLPDTVISVACANSCEKIGECGLDNLNCMNECVATVDDWSDSVIEVFAECLSNDLSCDEFGESANTAAQVCYDRLPTDAARLDRCRSFKAEIKECDPAASTSAFERACIRMARTTDASTWTENTGMCADLVGDCDASVVCIDEAFDLN